MNFADFLNRIATLPGISLLLEMSPYLLFGFLIAGILKLFIKSEQIERHLSGDGLWETVKASAFGVPLPICSCGVIPVSEHLKKSGASNSSVISFLVSAPTTGVDSILATYSLLGPVFAVFRPVASFVAGILSGTLVRFFGSAERSHGENNSMERVSCEIELNNEKPENKIVSALKYAFLELVESTGKWIVMGIIAGAAIDVFVPQPFVERFLSDRLISYAAMLMVGIPMYVCATGSIPIAASLVMKGMSPGAALIFLIAGPATNTATIAFVAGKMGKRTAVIYLASIGLTSLLFAFTFDAIASSAGISMMNAHHHSGFLPMWIKTASAILLTALIARPYMKRRKKMDGEKFYISDITCSHCVTTIERAVRGVAGVEDASVDVKKKTLFVKGNYKREDVLAAIRSAGYTV